MKEPESDPWAVFPDPYCGYCGRHFREHSEQDFRDCAVKSGGEVSDDGCVIASADFKGEDPDPAKRAARRREMLPKIMESICTCGKTIADHSREGIRACAHKQRDQMPCPACGKPYGMHSDEDFRAHARDQGK
jgi:hypothetical protein